MENYTIFYSRIESAYSEFCDIPDDGTVYTSSNATSMLLSGLKKGTFYSLSIVAYTIVGPSQPSSPNECIYSTALDGKLKYFVNAIV